MKVSVSAIAATAVAAVAVGLVATYLLPGSGGDPFAECRASAVAGGGAVGGPFTLTDQNGNTVTDKDVLKNPALVYFGYTFCPDICPVDVARNAEAVDIISEMGHEVTPVFISVDPRRDTPAVLRDWAASMHPRMIALTGTPEQIAAAAKAYRTFYKVPENPADQYYTVDHMTFTYLMLPGHGFVEFFKREDTPDQMAASVSCFLDVAASLD